MSPHQKNNCAIRFILRSVLLYISEPVRLTGSFFPGGLEKGISHTDLHHTDEGTVFMIRQ